MSAMVIYVLAKTAYVMKAILPRNLISTDEMASPVKTMQNSERDYSIILSKETLARIEQYAVSLNQGGPYGARLAEGISALEPRGRGARSFDLKTLDKWQLLSILINSKTPQIFAESQVVGDGSDWTLTELGLLGDFSIGMAVTVYDNGAHENPFTHSPPFTGHLIYTPGALLRNDRGHIPADWHAVTADDDYDKDKYYQLYERRFLPAFSYIDCLAIARGRPAFVTIPGMGCGQFAGPFKGQMGHIFRAALMRFLETHGDKFCGIKAVYYDPYNECVNETHRIKNIEFMIRPLAPYNPGKSQLCKPEVLGGDSSTDFSDCELYSFVAWDHVSWPGNDYYLGARVTDDGVKAAATDTMRMMTGVDGYYCRQTNMYRAPKPHKNWEEVVTRNELYIRAKDNLFIV
ncbi:MAG: hypothetical protein ABJN69_07905 [Hellea sp.]